LVRHPFKPVRFLSIEIGAFVDSTPAINLYRKLGLQVEKTFKDEEGD